MILDASIFSRALMSIDISSLKKYMDEGEHEIILGRATSMDGSILKFLRPKIVTAKKRFDDGSIFKFINKEDTFPVISVASGATFEELINSLEKEGYYPAIFPLYSKGSVGGFIASNGSGFGSYKFGFPKFKKTIYENTEKDSKITLVSYTELIESSTENQFAWSSIIIDNEKRYYIPNLYKSLVKDNTNVISTKDLIKTIFDKSLNIVKNGYIPICLRSTNLESFKEFPGTLYIGYEIRFNSPSKFFVMCGNIKDDELDKTFAFLKKHVDVLPFPSLREYDSIHKIIMDKYKKSVKIPKNLEKIKNEYLNAARCVNCGICLENCTSFKITNNIIYSPLGKFNRLITGESSSETCFGCKECEDSCPEGINISRITEVLPSINATKENVSISLEPVSFRIKELESKIDEKYKSQPPYILFIGCAYKYDPIGVEGLLDFLLENGNKISTSARVKIVDNLCCGFDKYITGKIDEARSDVLKIVELKKKYGANGVYFICPEGLYVYNTLTGDKGVLAFDIIKPFINASFHAGCWAQKLGIKGADKECASLFFTSYEKQSIPLKRKNILTICPFSTWKFGTKSVYSIFLKEITEKKEDIIQVSDTEIIEIMLTSLRDAALESVDDIAEKVETWIVGGKNYFVLLTIPIIRKRFTSDFKYNVLKNDKVKNFYKNLINNNILLNEKINRYIEIIKTENILEFVEELTKKILESPKLEFEARELVTRKEFLDALSEILKKVIEGKVIEDLIEDIALSS